MDPGSDPRWRIPAEDGLLLAVGRAVHGFAQLERSVGLLRRDLPGMLGDRFAGLSPEQAIAELEALSCAGDGSPGDGPPTDLVRILRRCCSLRDWRDSLLGLVARQGRSPALAPGQGHGPA